MPAKATDFIRYDPDWLCKWYEKQACLPGYQPYSEEYSFTAIAANKIEPRFRLEIEPGDFKIGSWGGNGDRVVEAGRQALLDAGKVSDENGSVVRLSDIYVPDGTSDIVLKVQRAKYGDQVRSNLIPDFTAEKPGCRQSLRALLRDEFGASLPPLSDGRLANTLARPSHPT